jgi:uncharacterized radical SAM superfamily Fe-S cluster-containing enzyme
VRNVNDDQLGGMIDFAIKHIGVIRALNIQPESFCGRTDLEDLSSQRITIPDALKRIEEQTDGDIAVEDFYPVPFVAPMSSFISAWSQKFQVEFTCHPACGAATYIFISGDRRIPITQFVDVEAFFNYISKVTAELEEHPGRITKSKVILKMARNFGRFVDDEKKPAELKLRSLMMSILGSGTYSALGDFHSKTLMIGIMHFMDPYNFDQQRVSKCAIHYATPDGRIIPFCSYNTIHRESVEAGLGVPIEEWTAREEGRPVEQAPEATSAK